MASNTKDLQGKIALVTGASRGIGAQIAEELAKRGARLYLTARSFSALLEVTQRIQSHSKEIQIHSKAIDLASPSAPAEIINDFLTYFEKIDILINNAGVAPIGPFSATTMTDYDDLMNLNLRAPFFLTQAAQPHLRAPARIINISSIAARTGFPIGVAYSMSKAGLEGMTRSLAKDFGKDGTTVNAVAPGVVETDILGTWEPGWIAEDAAVTPVERRTGKVDDVAQVVAWLAGESSRWVSGQTISASGASLMI